MFPQNLENVRPENSPASALKRGEQILAEGELVLVDAQAVIDTYSENERFSCQKYGEYQKLVSENPSFGYKRCAKLLGVPMGRTRWWHTKGKKKAVPLALKAVQKLESAGLLPFTSSHKRAPLVLNMLGVLFGDGGIDCRLNGVAFISSDKRDIDLWLSDLLEVFPFARGKTDIVEGGEYGHSYNLRCYDRAVIRFFAALGAPVGDKIITRYVLPPFLFSLRPRFAISFLDGLFASEIAVPRFAVSPHSTDYFKNFSLSLSKNVEIEESHRNFLEELKQLSKKASIQTTPYTRKDNGLSVLRKDGKTSCPFRIFFRCNLDNVFRFDKAFSLRYARNKKKKLESEVAKARAALAAKTIPFRPAAPSFAP
ncbi:MAG: hypothetical protein V1847_04575 [Candidatus Diapherotrites archaeon]